MIKLILFLTSYLFLRTMEKWNNERKANFNSPFLLIYGRYIFSFYFDSGLYTVRPVRLERSGKAFVDFIGSSLARKNKRFCFSLAYSKNSLTGGTPHCVRQTPPVGRSEKARRHSPELQWSPNTNTFDSRCHYLAS